MNFRERRLRIYIVLVKKLTAFKAFKRGRKKLGILLVGLGVRPNESVEEVPLMPKERYKIMRNYMPKKGSKGLE